MGKGIEYGVDGWRLDVAFCVGHPFWKKWRKHIRSINPEAYMTAEIVDSPEKVKPYMQGDEFDGEMNYNFAFAAAEFFFNTDSTRINASTFDKKLAELRGLYPDGVAYVSQNLFGSHDSNRIGSHIVNRGLGIGNFRNWGDYFNASQAAGNPEYSTRKPSREDVELQKLFAIMQMTYVGAPMIYYGDEVGMWGANDPDSRKPMIWEDITHKSEVYNADGSVHAPDTVTVNLDLRQHFKKLIEIRNNYPALQLGDFTTIITDDEKDIYGFKRSYHDDELFVIINNSKDDYTLEAPSIGNECFDDLLGGERMSAQFNIPKKWGVILKVCQ
jgi:glycosidase